MFGLRITSNTRVSASSSISVAAAMKKSARRTFTGSSSRVHGSVKLPPDPLAHRFDVDVLKAQVVVAGSQTLVVGAHAGTAGVPRVNDVDAVGQGPVPIGDFRAEEHDDVHAGETGEMGRPRIVR